MRSEEHTSELQSPDTISYAVFCLKKKKSANRDPRLSEYAQPRRLGEACVSNDAIKPVQLQVCHRLLLLFFYWHGDPRDLHCVRHSFPTRRSSDLGSFSAASSHLPRDRSIAMSGACATVRASLDRKSTRLNSSHLTQSRMPSSA